MHHAHPTAHAACALALFVGARDISKPTAKVDSKPPPPLTLSVSPDEQWLAVAWIAEGATTARVWSVPLARGDAREFAKVPASGASSLAWSSDGLLRMEWVDAKQGLRELRWSDPASGKVLRATHDREEIRTTLASSNGSWATVEEKHPGSKTVRTVQWPAEKLELDVVTLGESEFQLSPIPGVVFYSERLEDGVHLYRTEVATGSRREVARSDAPGFRWSASDDGGELLLCESGGDPRSRVIDAEQGTLIDGPWTVADTRWLQGGAGRYVFANDGARSYLIDTLRDRELSLPSEPWGWLWPLDDGRFLVEQGGRVLACDSSLEIVETLFDARTGETRVASR
jgi:hypothetical protein